MNKVYIVSERLYKKAFYAEPYDEEYIIEVFDDYHKTIDYICDTIKKIHKQFDKSKGNLTHLHNYDPNPDKFIEGHYIVGIEYETDYQYNSISYRFRSYEVK